MGSLLLCQALRLIASLTLSGAQCISPITIRPRISRLGCMRIIRTSGLTSSLALSSPVATNCMCRGYRVPEGLLLRTSAMLTRQHRARALTPARVAEHRHLHLRLQLQQQLQLQLRLQRQRQRQLQQRQLQLWRRGLRRRPGRVPHRRRDRSEFRDSFVGEAGSFPYSWFLM